MRGKGRPAFVPEGKVDNKSRLFKPYTVREGGAVFDKGVHLQGGGTRRSETERIGTSESSQGGGRLSGR